jgi:CubicO group peptidase (beta-lactamase class C family)
MTGGIERGAFPGGVVLVRHRGSVILRAAYGSTLKYMSATTLAPEPIPARTDTLYDLASISKLFTATCALRLVEDGKLRLDDAVARFLPEFGSNGKEAITIRQVLTHSAGLPAYLKLWELEPTPAARLRRALEVAPTDPPGTVYRYSDLGLIALGHLVEQVAGAGLDRVVAGTVTEPLQLRHVQYRPPAALKPLIAPTEDESAVGRGLVWGEVHDENAWYLGGVAGHAGLFGTADELGVFAQAFLDGGTRGGARLLRPETVAEMTRNQIGKLEWQGLGWELNADFYMGRLAAPETFGHTGYTGTSLVVDPRRQLVVVLLTNRVHPTREGPSTNPERQAVANAARVAADSA